MIIEMKNYGVYGRDSMLMLVATFVAMTCISLYLFFLGRSREDGEDSMYTLSALGLKFILSMVAALVWFAVLKKVKTGELILFFVIYLAFTIFLIGVIVKELKGSSLKK